MNPVRPLLATLLLALALILAPGAFAEDAARPVDEKAQAAELIAAFKSKSPETRVKAAVAAKDVQHDSLTSPLVKLLADKEWGVREAAVAALGNREGTSARKKASSSLAARLPRLAKDTSRVEETLQVIEALGKLEQPTAVKPLLGGIDLDTDIELVRARMMAVAEIPDKKAIEGLIDFLATGRRGGAGPQRDAARKALQYATGGDHRARDHKNAGKDADRWRAWWRENEKHFDFAAVKAAREQAAAEAKAKADRKRAQQEKRKRDKESRRKQKQKNKAGAPKSKDNVPD